MEVSNITGLDRNRKGGGIVHYVSNKTRFNAKNGISNKTENIFIELFI